MFLERRFYFAMSLLMAVVVAYGFHFTVEASLLHPAIPRPTMLWVHAGTFVAWLALFTTQTGLVSTRNVALHKRLGLFGIALGAAVFVVGTVTTVVMIRFHAAHPEPHSLPPSFASIPFDEMALFAGLFGTAVALRRTNREAHRRLMFMATCVLTSAAWGRFPQIPPWGGDLGVDFLILLGVTRDLFAMRRVHSTYLYGLPAIAAMQAVAATLFLVHPDWWLDTVMAIARG
jgi:hypothetical protein